ncbi:THO complex subunit Hpr1p [Monosporozyma unispora]|nr:hypothetical protein C6P44_002375 [Kazachstania unispora]
MTDCDNLIHACSDYVLNEIKSIRENSANTAILEHKSDVSQFNKDLIEYNWKPLEDIQISDFNKDLLTDLTLKKVINDILVTESEPNANPSETQLLHKLELTAYVLDLCFHSRTFRKDRIAWTTGYFDLLGLTMNLLSWPIDISKFWVYAETRIEWFKLQNFADEAEYDGVSQLISYKPPLSDKIRFWNDLLRVVQYNSALNTPQHYIMKHKLEQFISDLLPINEESNFNRSATVAKGQDSGNSWNAVMLSGRPSSREEKLATNFKFIQNKFITSPIEFAFKPLDFKSELQDALFSMLDALFDIENEFYRNAKFFRRGKLSIEDKLNENFDTDFNVNATTLPKYMKDSKKFEEQRYKLWEEITSFQDSSDLMIRSAFLDLSSHNHLSLYKQLTSSDNDYYRKQFVLQVIFACRIVERLFSEDDVRTFYKNCYAKDDLLKYINFDEIDEVNLRKTKTMCHHLAKMRISTFYITRDPSFYRIIQSLLKSDDSYLFAKIDGFKCFNNFNVSLVKSNKDSEINTDYNFKKFGFIKLGNKQINNVWKIQSGLESIPESVSNPKEIYDELKNSLFSDPSDSSEKDEIVKQWQTLRLLRSQYLFEFNKVNENSSMKGLFDSSLVDKSSESQEDKIKDIKTKMHEAHRRKLEQARGYQKNKLELKRKAEEVENDQGKEPDSIQHKKIKTDESATVNTESTEPIAKEGYNHDTKTPEEAILNEAEEKQVTSKQESAGPDIKIE